MSATTWKRLIAAVVMLLVSAASAQAAPVLLAQYDWDANKNGAIQYSNAGPWPPSLASFNPWPSGSADGLVAYINGGSLGWNTGLTMKANTVYTVTEAFGSRSDLPSPGTSFNLRTAYASGTFMTASYALGSGLTAGAFTDHSLTFSTATLTGQVGQTLWTESDSGLQTSYDNFRVYAQAAAAYWTGNTSVNWTDANWKTTATSNDAIVGAPDSQTNVHFSTTTPAAGNPSTTLNEDFDINSLTFDAAATSAATIAGSNTLKIEATAANGNTLGNGITVNTPSSGTPIQTISAKVGLASSQTWTVNSGAALTVSGEVGDFGAGNSLTKAGPGTLTLSGANTYTGPTTLSAGTLSVAASNNLGDGASNLVFDGGTLQVTLAALTNFSSIGHAVSFNPAKTVGLDINASDTTFTADLDLNQTTGGFTKLGAGAVVLNRTNTYTGGTTIHAGTLQIGDGTTDGSIASSSGITNYAALVYNLVGSQSYGNVISGTGTLTKTGPGTLTLSNRNGYTGGTIVTGGTLILNSAAIGNPAAILPGNSDLTITGAGSTVSIRGIHHNAIYNPDKGTVTINAGGLLSDDGTGDNANRLFNLVPESVTLFS